MSIASFTRSNRSRHQTLHPEVVFLARWRLLFQGGLGQKMPIPAAIFAID